MQLFRLDTEKTEGFKVLFLTRHNLSSNLDQLNKYYFDPLKVKTDSKLSEVVIASIFDREITGLNYPVKAMDIALKEVYKFIEIHGINFVYVMDKDISNRISMDKSHDMRDVYLEAKGNCNETVRFMCGVNYRTLSRTPSNETVLNQSLEDVVLELKGIGSVGSSKEIVDKLGLEMIYPKTIQEIEDTMNSLLKEKIIGSDIETYSLQTQDASIASISFSPNKKLGYSFTTNFINDSPDRYPQVKPILREFFEQYKGSMMFFNSVFDAKIITYELFMKHATDFVGARRGMDLLYENGQDPLLQAFCLRNSSIKPELGLKVLLYKYFGNYGIDVKDIRLVSEQDLLYYGCLDSIGLHYIHEEFNGLMDAGDNRYYNFLKDSRKIITEMELSGMHMSMPIVNELHKYLASETEKENNKLLAMPEVKRTENLIAGEKFAKNFSNKRVVKTLKDYREPFNFGSSTQLSKLLFEVLDLPVVLETDKGNASSGKDALNILRNSFENEEAVVRIIDTISNLKKYEIVLNTFIPAYSKYRWEKDDGGHLCGNINLIGTQSGRYSSSNPNMTNQPTWDKIKECFTTPEGYVMFSADFSSLEDRGSAIKTNDPNKIIIFEKDLDSHMFKASYYFEDLIDIEFDRENKEDLKKLKKLFGHLRDDSKPVTFGKTYGGGDQFLIRKGYSPERIVKINTGWNAMYSHSILFERSTRQKAEANGYLELLFGLKIRTPVLHSKKSTPNAKSAEFRSVFNAVTQCFGMLTSRAAEEFIRRVRKAPMNIQEGVHLANIIHDDIIGYCKEEPEIISWVNKNLIECMEWQDDPYVAHDTVKMTSELDIGKNWKDMVTISNNAPIEEINEALIKLKGDFNG